MGAGILPPENLSVVGGQGVGSDNTLIIPAGKVYDILGINFTFVTDGTAANRTIKLLVNDGTNEYWRCVGSVTIPASTSAIVVCGRMKTLPTSTTTLQFLDLPEFPLAPGHQFKTLITNLQATDSVGNFQLVLNKYTTT